MLKFSHSKKKIIIIIKTNLKCEIINIGCLVAWHFHKNVSIIVQSTNPVFIQHQCYYDGKAIKVGAILIAIDLWIF